MAKNCVYFFCLISCFINVDVEACDQPAYELLSKWRDSLIAAPDTLSEQELSSITIPAIINQSSQYESGDPFDGFVLAEQYTGTKPRWDRSDYDYACNYHEGCNQYDLSCLAWAKEKCEKYRTPSSADVNELAASNWWQTDFEIPRCMEQKIITRFEHLKKKYIDTFQDKIPKSRKHVSYSFSVDRIGECPGGGESPFMACFLRDRDIVIHKKLVRAAFTDVAEAIGKVRVGFDPAVNDPGMTNEDKQAVISALESRMDRFVRSFDFLIVHELTHAFFGAISGEYFADCMAHGFMTLQTGSLDLGVWEILSKAKNTAYVGQLSDVQYGEFSDRFNTLEHLPKNVSFEYCRENYFAKRYTKSSLIDESAFDLLGLDESELYPIDLDQGAFESIDFDFSGEPQ